MVTEFEYMTKQKSFSTEPHCFLQQENGTLSRKLFCLVPSDKIQKHLHKSWNFQKLTCFSLILSLD